MSWRYVLTAIMVFTLQMQLFAQQNDPVLFTVNGAPVHVSEFEYIYQKTNGDKADYSRASLDEYLRLYTKFKLKVAKAKELQLDTIPSLMQELAGYRRQLADSYLIDKEVTDRLIEEGYERKQQDVNISHIVIAVKPDAGPSEVEAARKKALDLKKQIAEGAVFDSLAVQYSGDKSAKRNYGHIGFVSALFPSGLYELESAAYTQPIGELSDPIRTAAGFHLLMVHERRPARGEIEVAHILIRNAKPGSKDDAKAKIDSLYQMLQNGDNFEDLAKAYSEDNRSATKGGYLGFFGINRYERAFEDAAFGLEENGDYCKPIQSAAGWHIIKRVSKKVEEPYNIAKSRLQTQIKKDPRFEASKRAMIERIKSENKFIEFNKTLESFIESLDEEFLTYKWKAPEEKSEEPLFIFGKDYKVSLGEYTDYLGRSSRKRIRMGKSTSIEEAVNTLYQDFVDESALKFEEQQLDKKYPEFKSLMREYEEGILLFEATKMLVWDKAAQDTAGLEKFFEKIDGRYKWRERAVTSIYTIKTDDEKELEKIQAFIRKNEPSKVLDKFNTPGREVVAHSSKTFEKGRNLAMNNMDWKVGAISESEENPREKTFSFFKIEEIMPSKSKTLAEARGYVVADYQDQLEREWVAELRKEFKIDIDQKVFDDLVKE